VVEKLENTNKINSPREVIRLGVISGDNLLEKLVLVAVSLIVFGAKHPLVLGKPLGVLLTHL
jgi:hypothetical protein